MNRIQYRQGSFNYVANGTTYSDAVGYWYEYLDYGDTSSTNIGELDKLSVLEAGINRETTISYEYDEFYRLKEKLLDTAGALSITTNYTFREVSHKTSMLVSSYTSTVSGTSGTTVNSYSYTYDVDGNITQIVDGNGKKISYKYDDLGQLIRENNEVLGKTYVYTYNKGGNRTSKKTYAYTTGTLGTATATETYTYGNASWGDQLTAIGSTSISYDAIGNPTTFNGDDLTWHGRQLKQMSRNGGQSLLKFMYNADGIRTNKIVDGVNHVYTLNGTQIVSEAWGSNLLIFLYDESGSPIGMQYRTTGYNQYDFTTFYFEKNLQGDIIAVYNESGVKVVSYTYDAWGNHTTTWHYSIGVNLYATYNPFRYRGYYYDTETGLYYLQSRYYNPQWGRFLNPDGYVNANGDLVGFNMYAYCSNNPVSGIDPTGCSEYTWWEQFLIGMGIKKDEPERESFFTDDCYTPPATMNTYYDFPTMQRDEEYTLVKWDSFTFFLSSTSAETIADNTRKDYSRHALYQATLKFAQGIVPITGNFGTLYVLGLIGKGIGVLAAPAKKPKVTICPGEYTTIVALYQRNSDGDYLIVRRIYSNYDSDYNMPWSTATYNGDDLRKYARVNSVGIKYYH